MRTHLLKTRIVITVFLGLVLAMLLIDIVAFVLLFQYQTKQKITYVERVLTDLDAGSISFSPNDSLNQKLQRAYDKIHSMVGDDCLGITVKMRDGRFVWFNSEEYSGFESILSNAIAANSMTVKPLSGLNFPYFFLPEVIGVAAPVSKVTDPEGQIAGIGIVLTTSRLIDDLWDKQKIVFVYMLINGIIIATLVFFRLRKVLFDPVQHLVHVAENYRVAEGGGLFPDSAESEFGQLSRAMNSMVSRIEQDRERLFESVKSLAEANKQLQLAQGEVVRAEKLAATGRLFAGLAHEIGNPVAIVQGYLELLQHDDIDFEDRKQFARRGSQELQRIDNLLKQLLDTTRKNTMETERVEINRLVHNLLEILEVPFSKKEISVDSVYSKDKLFVTGDKEQFHQVLLNILINAMDAVANMPYEPFEGRISLKIFPQSLGNARFAIIEILDNGSGINEKDMEFIFEPFFTTKAPGQGTGLGLAVSERIIGSYGGRIDVESKKNEFTRFKISLPLSENGNHHAHQGKS